MARTHASATTSSTPVAATAARVPEGRTRSRTLAADAGYDADLVRAVEDVNERQKHVLAEKLLGYFGDSLAGRTMALWGLAFKPDTDDMREAPSRALMEAVWSAGGCVRAYDPQAMDEARRLYGERPDLVLCQRREDALAGADALLVATEWHEFRTLDCQALRRALKQPVVFDGRNLYDPALLAEQGIDHIGNRARQRQREGMSRRALAAALALWACAAAASVEDRRWCRTTTEHFDLVTDLSPRRAAALLAGLDRFRTAASALLPGGRWTRQPRHGCSSSSGHRISRRCSICQTSSASCSPRCCRACWHSARTAKAATCTPSPTTNTRIFCCAAARC